MHGAGGRVRRGGLDEGARLGRLPAFRATVLRLTLAWYENARSRDEKHERIGRTHERTGRTHGRTRTVGRTNEQTQTRRHKEMNRDEVNNGQ